MIWPNIGQEPCQELEMQKDETQFLTWKGSESREEDTDSWNTSDIASVTDVYKGRRVVHPQEGGTKAKSS